MPPQPVVTRVAQRRDARKTHPARGLMFMVWTLSNRLLFTAIFISGASALIYQLIWVRLLGLVFGVSSFAVATVVAVFLLGLGLVWPLQLCSLVVGRPTHAKGNLHDGHTRGYWYQWQSPSTTFICAFSDAFPRCPFHLCLKAFALKCGLT